MKNNFILGFIILTSIVFLWFFINREGFSSFFSSSYGISAKKSSFDPTKKSKKKWG